MKNIILTMITSLVLFASCEDVEPDRFVVDDVYVELIQSLDGYFPRYEVKVYNPKNLKIDKVGLRLKYHDQAATIYDKDEEKNVELTCEDGKYLYDEAKKDFPYAYSGDLITAYAYAVADGLTLGTRVNYFFVPGKTEPKVTSAKFVFDDPSLVTTNKGTVYIYGYFAARHIRHRKGTYITLPDDESMFKYYPDSIVIRDCYAGIYGTGSIVFNQYGKDYTIDVDVPGELSIAKLDNYYVSLRDYLTLKVSGLREDCTYEVEGMTIENIGRGTITCKPSQTGTQRICLIEKHETFSMKAFSKEPVTVTN